MPAVETEIAFEDPFFEPPDLTVTPSVVGATRALMPIVSTVSSTGFFVQIRDSQDRLVESNVSYLACGI